MTTPAEKPAPKVRKPRKPRVPKPKASVRPIKKEPPVSETPPLAARVNKPPTKRTYLFAVGRRKSAIARVRLSLGERETLTVNNAPLEHVFPSATLQSIVRDPLAVTASVTTGSVSIFTHGGGKHSQAEAARLGLSRVLVLANADLRPALKHAGFLMRDPRVKERKKYGLKRARRAPQWQKR